MNQCSYCPMKPTRTTGVEDHRNHLNSHTTVHPRYRHSTSSLGSLMGRRGNVTNFLLFTYTCLPHVGLSLHTFIMILLSSLRSVSSPCLFIYTCLPLVFQRMYFIHATYMPLFLPTYYMPCKHGSFVYKLVCRLSLFFS